MCFTGLSNMLGSQQAGQLLNAEQEHTGKLGRRGIRGTGGAMGNTEQRVGSRRTERSRKTENNRRWQHAKAGAGARSSRLLLAGSELCPPLRRVKGQRRTAAHHDRHGDALHNHARPHKVLRQRALAVLERHQATQQNASSGARTHQHLRGAEGGGGGGSGGEPAVQNPGAAGSRRAATTFC